jgi:hypothetical protein
MNDTPFNSISGYLNGMAYSESSKDFSSASDSTGVSGTRVFIIAWENRIKFVSALRGVKIGSVVFKPTQKFPGYKYCGCTSTTTVGLGKPSNVDGSPSYPYAKITAKYTTKTDDSTSEDTEISSDPLLMTQEMDFDADFYEFGQFKYFWSDGTPIAEKTQNRKIMPLITHVMTDEKIDNLLTRKTFIVGRMCKINSTSYRKVDAETLMFLGARANRQITGAGEQSWKLTLTFKERPGVSWNKLYNEKTNAYEYVYDKDGNISPIYQLIDFKGLISNDSTVDHA